MAKKPTWVELLRERRQRLFVGRAEELASLPAQFRGPGATLPGFALQGEPGVGKSFLTAHLQGVAREAGALTALTGGTGDARALREQAILSAMSRLAAGLAEAGAPLRVFEQRYKEYRECIAEVDQDPAAPHSASDAITPLYPLRWAERVSTEGDHAAAGETEVATWSAYLGQRFPSRETVALVAAQSRR